MSSPSQVDPSAQFKLAIEQCCCGMSLAYKTSSLAQEEPLMRSSGASIDPGYLPRIVAQGGIDLLEHVSPFSFCNNHFSRSHLLLTVWYDWISAKQLSYAAVRLVLLFARLASHTATSSLTYSPQIPPAATLMVLKGYILLAEIQRGCAWLSDWN